MHPRSQALLLRGHCGHNRQKWAEVTGSKSDGKQASGQVRGMAGRLGQTRVGITSKSQRAIKDRVSESSRAMGLNHEGHTVPHHHITPGRDGLWTGSQDTGPELVL